MPSSDGEEDGLALRSQRNRPPQPSSSSETSSSAQIPKSSRVLIPNSQIESVPSPSVNEVNKPAMPVRIVPMPDFLKHGYLPLVDRVHCEELNRAHPVIAGLPLSTFRRVCMPILASMHDEVLAGIVNGDLAQKHMQGDKVLVKLYGDSASSENTNWMKNAEGVSPALYCRTLVETTNGTPPSATQKTQIVQALRRYISREPRDVQFATEIDNKPPITRKRKSSTEEDIKNGLHVYLRNNGQRIEARVARIEAFCNAVEKICKSPLSSRLAKAAWFYIGYSLVPNDRIADHDSGRSSFLINLVTRICEVLFASAFTVETFILAYLASEKEAAIGEILLTGIALAYHQGGTGFCIHPAGTNNASARMDEINQREARDIWQQCQSFRLSDTPYIENMRRTNQWADQKAEMKNRESAEKKQNLLNLREECSQLRPDYTGYEAQVHSELALESGEEEELGDFAGLFRSKLEAHLAKDRQDATAWDSSNEDITDRGSSR
jgi:hypothetical protein